MLGRCRPVEALGFDDVVADIYDSGVDNRRAIAAVFGSRSNRTA